MHLRLGDLLVRHNLITREELRSAMESQKLSNRKRIGEILLENDRVEKIDLLKMLALQLEIPFLDLEKMDIDPKAVKLLPDKLASKYCCVPLRWEANGDLLVVMTDPLNLQAIDDVSQVAKCEIRPALAVPDQIRKLIKEYNRSDRVGENSAPFPELDELVKVIKPSESEVGREENISELRKETQQAPIISIVDVILNEAIEEGATDIHIEPQADSLLIRDRIDGVLYEMHQLPLWIHRPVVSRIKVMADMDIAEKRIPQDGKVRISLASRHFDLRISTLPLIFGEKVAIRLLERKGTYTKLDDLGFTPVHLKRMRRLNVRKQGLILVTGPTGSGKSTTLNSILHEIQSPKVNIVTVEDPVEYEITKISQVQVNRKAGLTFAYVLRSILRQDPDVIMVGEIRDAETAEIALRAGMTGHLVLSTLHTNDAPSAVTRLVNLGMPPYLVSSTLLYVLAQRLVRRLCKYCSQEYEPSAEEFEQVELILPEASQLVWRRGIGCPKCKKRGFLGRIAVSELFMTNNEIRRAIETHEPESVIQSLAVLNGMRPLMADFVDKISSGDTAMSEIWNVIVGEEVTASICPNCSARIEESYLACPSCGFALKDKCPECGWTLEKNWRFCPSCQRERYLPSALIS